MRIMLRSKLHRLHLTGADPDYEGSIAIDTNLLAAAGIIENEMVHVYLRDAVSLRPDLVSRSTTPQ